LADVRDARRISPLYADAAALAHRGFDARGVAEECGISVAEAELVMAMSRDDKDFDSEVEDDADGRKQGTAD
jgi:orotate phosphoribosyltransferase-like protein